MKTYRYKGGKTLTQAEAEAQGLHPTRDRKGKTPVQNKRYTVDWNAHSKLDQWRERLATMQNAALVQNVAPAQGVSPMTTAPAPQQAPYGQVPPTNGPTAQ